MPLCDYSDTGTARLGGLGGLRVLVGVAGDMPSEVPPQEPPELVEIKDEEVAAVMTTIPEVARDGSRVLSGGAAGGVTNSGSRGAGEQCEACLHRPAVPAACRLRATAAATAAASGPAVPTPCCLVSAVRYGISDVPPWYLCILLVRRACQHCIPGCIQPMCAPFSLFFFVSTPPWCRRRHPASAACFQGFQTFLTMLGATVLIPLLIVPQMGGTTEDAANVICTCFFASGINTLLQTLLGARLPVVQVRRAAIIPKLPKSTGGQDGWSGSPARPFSGGHAATLHLFPASTAITMPLLPMCASTGRQLCLHLACAGHHRQHPGLHDLRK